MIDGDSRFQRKLQLQQKGYKKMAWPCQATVSKTWGAGRLRIENLGANLSMIYQRQVPPGLRECSSSARDSVMFIWHHSLGQPSNCSKGEQECRDAYSKWECDWYAICNALWMRNITVYDKTMKLMEMLVFALKTVWHWKWVYLFPTKRNRTYLSRRTQRL